MTKNVLILSNNIQFLHLFFRYQEKYNSSDNVKFWIFSDSRITNLEEFKNSLTFFMKESPIDYEFVSVRLVDYIKDFVSSNDEDINMYIDYQTHHLKLGAMLYAGRELKIDQFVFLDDDVVTTKSLEAMFEVDTLFAGFRTNDIFSMYSSKKERHVKEVESWKKIFPSLSSKEWEFFETSGMYNAGHFFFTYDEEFELRTKMFYEDPYLKEKFFKHVFDKHNLLVKARGRNHASFTDEQRFLTYYFLHRNSISKYTAKEVYLLYQGTDRFFREFPSAEVFSRKISGKAVIHYCSSQKDMIYDFLKGYIDNNLESVYEKNVPKSPKEELLLF